MNEIADWMKEIQKTENSAKFSELVHNYHKLAVMRIMQVMRNKYKIPPEELVNLMMAIFSRMLNESCYAVGANIRNEYPINSFFTQEHLMNLVNVLNGQPLKHHDRNDIDTDIQAGLKRFKDFILENSPEFEKDV